MAIDRGDHIYLERTVAFGDCDPAGIAYTGKLIDYALEAIDSFWKIALDGLGWFELNIDHNIGTPFVNINIDFSGAITPREKLIMWVRPVQLGTTSIVFEIVAVQNRQLCFKGQFTCVFVAKDRIEKIAPPDWIAQSVKRFKERPSTVPFDQQ